MGPSQADQRKAAEPGEVRDRTFAEELAELPARLAKGLLHDVRGVDPRGDAPVQTSHDHPPQPRTMPLEQPADRTVVTFSGPTQQLLGLGAVERYHVALFHQAAS